MAIPYLTVSLCEPGKPISTHNTRDWMHAAGRMTIICSMCSEASCEFHLVAVSVSVFQQCPYTSPCDTQLVPDHK